MNVTALSLYELNNLVRGALKDNLPEMFWIRAETSDVRVNQNGHCYLEFIEKDAQGKTIIAKSRGMIWGNRFHILRAYFEDVTQQPFKSGLKVLVRVNIDFHEVYGLTLTVHDIDPSYTLGDQALNRAAILKQLEEEGVLSLNKELSFPPTINRIAIISSPTAAGYEDFCNQLENNTYGFVFYKKLFSALMQGDRVESSIISALEKIYNYQHCFDAVVIIRGGGATSDLSSFDSYLLAASCAQFPVPIITGIGHERDETVLDIIAHTRTKTPTAVAEFLIDNMVQAQTELEHIHYVISSSVEEKLQDAEMQIKTYQAQAGYALKGWHKDQVNLLSSVKSKLNQNLRQAFKDTKNKLDIFEKHLGLVSPHNVLKKGYTLTLKDGKTMRGVDELKAGDLITTMFWDGKINSTIE